MKSTQHTLLVGIFGIIIYFVAWNIYGKMMRQIFSHRDSGYKSQDAIVARRLDQAITIYILPAAIVFGIIGFIAPESSGSLLSSSTLGHAPFIFCAAVWAIMIYGILYLSFFLLRCWQRRQWHRPKS